MVTIKQSGNFKHAEHFFQFAKKNKIKDILDKYGKKGVEILKAATPVLSGKTADSWDYEIKHTGKGWELNWLNTNENEGANIAVLIQYGHATGWGGYVKGINFINPATKDLLNDLSEEIWKELTEL